MASIEYLARTTRVIAYVNKEKLSFTIGRVPKKTAERFANNIDTLLHERRCNLPISREVSNWLADLDDTLYGLLAERGLVEARVKAGTLATCKRRRESVAGGGEKVRQRDQIKSRRAAGVNSPTFVCVWISVVSDGPLTREAGRFHRSLRECGCGASGGPRVLRSAVRFP